MAAGAIRPLAIGAALLALPSALAAHPMPDTAIEVARDADRVTFTIRIPLDDLKLVMPDLDTAAPLSDSARAQIAAYIAAHLQLESASGEILPETVDDVQAQEGADDHVGHFHEAVITVRAATSGGGTLTLHYDAVLHRIANHRALVSGPDGAAIGTIRFSLAEKRATPLVLAGPSD